MVQLKEVPDEHFVEPQVGPEEDDGDFTDTGKLESINTMARLEARVFCSSCLALSRHSPPMAVCAFAASQSVPALLPPS